MSRNGKLDKRSLVSSPAAKASPAKTPVLLLSISVALALGVISYARPNGKAAAHSQAGAAAVDNVSSAFDGKKNKRVAVEGSDVKNFGKVNDHIYRGGQPSADEYKELVALGIKTVIDLREDPEKYARQSAEGAGLQYINIRLNSKHPPTEEESNHFLQLVNDEGNWPVYVHCAAGRHRTGVLLAVYRMEVDGWDARRAYEEMKEYKFYSRFGHGDMKDYVFEYYDKMRARRAALLTPAVKAKHATGDGQDN